MSESDRAHPETDLALQRGDLAKLRRPAEERNEEAEARLVEPIRQR